MIASKNMQAYFQQIEKSVEQAYALAGKAREKGLDPETKVDIPLARNMAERVEGLLSVIAPQLLGSGMTDYILELEKKYGAGAWEVALLTAEEVAKEKFCKFEEKKEAMEMGIRAGMAYSTAGIVAAPLEGFIELRLKKRADGKEYFSVVYAGPIRGAGGTAASVSVLIADYVRLKLGYAPYDPTEDEIKRCITEIIDYHERVTNLQYFPSEQEIEFMARHVPVEINGDPTEKIDVSNYKGLPRVETDRIRGGMCLVMAEGLTQKSPKLWKRLQKWGKDFGLEWGFLEEFLNLQKRIKAQSQTEKKEETKKKITPNFTFIKDMVAGRPVITYPLKEGGLRLRMGRCRTSGFSSSAMHPASQLMLNNYIAIGTQLKIERPGKGATITSCEVLEGPTVKLTDGSVKQLHTLQDAKNELKHVDKVLFLGDILINYGDFSENGHMLVPAGYCEEWYVQEVEKAAVTKLGSLDVEKLAQVISLSPQNTQRILSEPFYFKPDVDAAITISKELAVPLHPLYVYHWKCITASQLLSLVHMLQQGKIHVKEEGNKIVIEKVVLKLTPKKIILESMGIPHTVINKEFIVLSHTEAQALLTTLSAENNTEKRLQELATFLQTQILQEQQEVEKKEIIQEQNALECIIQWNKQVKGIIIRDKSGTFIGARMGRPEKAKMRALTGSPQVLFPVGDEGGRLRCFQSALEAGKITANFPVRKCIACSKETLYVTCEHCNGQTEGLFFCKKCGIIDKPSCPAHGPCTTHTRKSISTKEYFQQALDLIKVRNYPDLIKGVRGTANKDHIPEHLAKGILRASHDIYVNKDGTTRYDMTELPITHFKPYEIGTSIEKLKELTYTHDIHGKCLEQDDQILEIKPQDIILPAHPEGNDEPGDEITRRIANFVDQLLTKFYKLKPFYNINSREDIVGHLIIGLAPHISAGTIGRIIGFSTTQGMYCHPLFHAAMRRDCDGDEACMILLMDALLNFSRQFLPDRRGSRTMDSPLVLTSVLLPTEVDDQAHGIDVVWKYPLELYEACLAYKQPWDITIEQIKHRLNTEGQYEGMGYTHPVENINTGIRSSAYKTLPSMEEKLLGQMEIAERLNAVDEHDVARLVIEKHFIRDIKGNLRKFSQQQFRCVNCNAKYPRPPLVGKCINCAGGKIIFTISEGSVVKYLEPSMSLTRKYNLPPYLNQTMEILQRRIEAMFGREKEKQTGLGSWFG